jgi:hypothetical protein
MKLFKRSFVAFFSLLFVMVVAAPVMFAADLSTTYLTTPKIVTGSEKLIKDASQWLLLLIPITGGLMVGWQQYMKKWAQEPGDIALRDKRSKAIAIASVIAFCADGLISALLAYYR